MRTPAARSSASTSLCTLHRRDRTMLTGCSGGRRRRTSGQVPAKLVRFAIPASFHWGLCSRRSSATAPSRRGCANTSRRRSNRTGTARPASSRWGFGLGEPVPRGQLNGVIMMAEVGEPGAWSRVFNGPNVTKFEDPTVVGVDYPFGRHLPGVGRPPGAASGLGNVRGRSCSAQRAHPLLGDTPADTCRAPQPRR